MINGFKTPVYSKTDFEELYVVDIEYVDKDDPYFALMSANRVDDPDNPRPMIFFIDGLWAKMLEVAIKIDRVINVREVFENRLIPIYWQANDDDDYNAAKDLMVREMSCLSEFAGHSRDPWNMIRVVVQFQEYEPIINAITSEFVFNDMFAYVLRHWRVDEDEVIRIMRDPDYEPEVSFHDALIDMDLGDKGRVR